MTQPGSRERRWATLVGPTRLRLLFALLLVAGIVGGLAVALRPASAVAVDYCFGQWEWVTGDADVGHDYWGAPDRANVVGVFDMRSLPQQAQAGGTPEGYGLFAYSKVQTDPGLNLYCIPSLHANLSAGQKNGIRNRLGILDDITSTTFGDAIWELLTVKADPTGQTRWKPLMPAVDGKLSLWLGEKTPAKQVRIIPGQSREWPGIVATYQNDYRQLYAENPTIARKQLDVWSKDYKLAWQTFVPADMPQEEPILHATTISDNFNCADSTTIGCQLAWTEQTGSWSVISNTAGTTTNADALARADSDLSSSDMTSQTTVTTQADFQFVGVYGRVSSSATTGYVYIRRSQNGNSHSLEKVVAGVFTSLYTVANDYPHPARPYNIKLTVNGTDLTGTQATTDKVTGSDSAISTGVRAGMYQYHADVRQDDFTASDIGGAPTPTPTFTPTPTATFTPTPTPQGRAYMLFSAQSLRR